MKIERTLVLLLVAGAAGATSCTAILGTFDFEGEPIGGTGGTASSSSSSLGGSGGGTVCAMACAADSECASSGAPCVAGVCEAGCCIVTATVPSPNTCMLTGGGDGVCGDLAGSAAGECVECNSADDCTGSDACTVNKCLPPSCSDEVKDGDETDVDCGGMICAACTPGKACQQNTDCESGYCNGNVCKAASCTDLVQDGTETDVDCGGSCTTKCLDGKKCAAPSDCASNECYGGTCVSCSDGVKNGKETDTDCGGSCTTKCAGGQQCAIDSDCASDSCYGGTCVSCSDGLKNGDETDIDCGGSCVTKCKFGAGCTVHADCASGHCGAACDAQTVSANPLGTAVHDIVVDATNVYWLGGGLADGQVLKALASGGTATVMANGQSNPVRLAVDGAHIYWANYGTVPTPNGSVWRVPINSPLAGVQLVGGQAQPYSIAVGSSSIFWTNSWTQTVNRATLSGGSPNILASGFGAYMTADDLYVYGMDSEASPVQRVSTGGGSVTTLCSATSAIDIAADGTYLYWADYDSSAIMRVHRTGGTPTVMASGAELVGVRALAVDAAHLYWSGWSSSNDSVIVRMPKAGGTREPIVTGLTYSAEPLALDLNHVYWGASDGTIKRVNK